MTTMHQSNRQQELERLFNQRKGHTPHISVTDDGHHVTEAIGSYYDDEQSPAAQRRETRPLSYMHAPSEVYEGKSNTKRQGSYFDPQKMQAHTPRSPVLRTNSGERVSSPLDEGRMSPKSPKSITRVGSVGSESGNVHASGPVSPPPLTRQSSSETAIQQFPLNDIDYESSPAAVAQELSNLQAIRRMSMSVDTADPDLPSFSGSLNSVPAIAPTHGEDEDDASRLFWVPARLHPELAPKEFKTFVEDRVEKIRRRSGGEEGLGPDSLERSSSGSSSLRRKKSMLSHSIDTKGNYEDGAERLERKKSRGMQVEGRAVVANLSDLETLVNDPAQLMRRMSLDTVRRSQDSGIEVPATEDMPILPPVSQSLKRSTRTTYRRGSLKKGERVPFSKRAQQRQTDSDVEPDSPIQPTSGSSLDRFEREPIMGISRVQTEPIPPPKDVKPREAHIPSSRPSSRQKAGPGASDSREQPVAPTLERRASLPSERQSEEEEQPRNSQQQPRQFQSRLASGTGRTTAQLPGYNNTNPLPHIIETLPDGTKVSLGNAAQIQHPERKSSHDMPRPVQRGGAHMRPAPSQRQTAPSSTLDDISSTPSPLPGSGNSRTDALTLVPTFEEKKTEKKDGSRKSSWKWILGGDDDEKDKKTKEEKLSEAALAKSKASKLSKQPADKARLDVLQNSIDGTVPSRGRESVVLNREDIKLEEERKKEGKKSSESARKDKDKETGLLHAIFGGKKKTSDSDLKEKKRKFDRGLSPEPPPRLLKPDIDYNWTRFSILEERAIYRMAHIKLANPRRALYSQVLLSNFMYSYLAKVQMMHPQIQIPASQQKAAQQRGQQKEEQQQQPAEYSQYQRWQEQQARLESAEKNSKQQRRSSFDMVAAGAQQPQAQPQPQQQQQQQQYTHRQQRQPQQQGGGGYDIMEDHSHDPGSPQEYEQLQRHHSVQPMATTARTNGGNASGSGYSVASTHDYLGYPKGQQPFGSVQESLWDDDQTDDPW